MQPFMNYPNTNPYNQYYQPYAQNIGHSNLNGRIVNDFSEVSASDVAMNGQPSIFVKSDLSEMCVRKWENNGTISNLTFKPYYDVLPNNRTNETEKAVNDPFRAITDRLDELSTKLDGMIKPVKGRKDGRNDESSTDA